MIGPLEKQGVRSITSSRLLASRLGHNPGDSGSSARNTWTPQSSGEPADGDAGVRRRARFAGFGG